MSPDFSPAWKAAEAKLRRAHEHLDTLGAEIAGLRARNVHTVTVHREADSGWWIAKARINEEPSPRLSVIVGEVAYECLSALNHLTWELAIRKFGERRVARVKHAVQFPVAFSPSHFAKLALVRDGLVSQKALAKMRRLQPYNGGRGPSGPNKPLALIKEIADADKHRVLAAGFPAPDFSGMEFVWDKGRASSERIGAYALFGFVRDGTRIARIRFEVGNDEAKVGVKGEPTPDVGFRTESWTIRRADLEACVSWAFGALRAFAPLFPPK